MVVVVNSEEVVGLTNSVVETKAGVGVVEAAAMVALAGYCCTEHIERMDST